VKPRRAVRMGVLSILPGGSVAFQDPRTILCDLCGSSFAHFAVKVFISSGKETGFNRKDAKKIRKRQKERLRPESL